MNSKSINVICYLLINIAIFMKNTETRTFDGAKFHPVSESRGMLFSRLYLLLSARASKLHFIP